MGKGPRGSRFGAVADPSVQRDRQPDSGACCGPTTAPEGDLAALAQVMRALADPTRLGILALLMQSDTLCVCHLVAAFPLGQPTISHHLRLLRQAGLVDCWRRGTWCYYHLLPATRPIVAWALALPQALGAAAGAPHDTSHDRRSEHVG